MKLQRVNVLETRGQGRGSRGCSRILSCGFKQALTHSCWLSSVGSVIPESLVPSSGINEKKVTVFVGNGASIKLDAICEMEQSVASIYRQVYV